MKHVTTTAVVFLLSAMSLLHAQTPNAADPDFFETKVRPVLANNCFACHAESGLGGLRLDSEDDAFVTWHASSPQTPKTQISTNSKIRKI